MSGSEDESLPVKEWLSLTSIRSIQPGLKRLSGVRAVQRSRSACFEHDALIAAMSWLALSLLALGYLLKYLPWDSDDAMIVYRIVGNLLTGHGWTYNIGESYNAST